MLEGSCYFIYIVREDYIGRAMFWVEIEFGVKFGVYLELELMMSGMDMIKC